MGVQRKLAYNERLFKRNGLRAYYHSYRFHWLARTIRALHRSRLSVLELGCFDAKSIRFIEQSTPVTRYLGLDADWEGGLSAGQQVWKDRPEIELRFCRNPDELAGVSESFDLGLCMETLEHLPVEVAEKYLREMSRLVRGYLLVTVPIERGPVFLVKHALKTIFRMEDNRITPADFLYSVIGRMDKVQRDEHLGFDDRFLIKQIATHFDILRVEGMAPHIRPAHWNLGIGILARARSG